jgi:hypothetical protein
LYNNHILYFKKYHISRKQEFGGWISNSEIKNDWFWTRKIKKKGGGEIKRIGGLIKEGYKKNYEKMKFLIKIK